MYIFGYPIGLKRSGAVNLVEKMVHNYSMWVMNTNQSQSSSTLNLLNLIVILELINNIVIDYGEFMKIAVIVDNWKKANISWMLYELYNEY